MINEILKTLKEITGWRFYFITILLFFTALGYGFKDSLDVLIRNYMFQNMEFREPKNKDGLEKAIIGTLLRHPEIIKYGVYLYQPKEASYYKKLILTNSVVAKSSPALQGIYLKDQPSINKVFVDKEYYIVTSKEMEKPDLVYLKHLNNTWVLFYKLSSNGKPIGEIVLSFYSEPLPAELDLVLKELSPLIYMYII